MPHRRKYERTPDTVALLGAVTVASAVMVVLQVPPPSIVEQIHAPLAQAWSLVLTVAAATALTGVLWRKPERGWALEAAGRIALAFTALPYVIVLWTSADGFGSSLVVAMLAALVLSSAVRAVQLWRRLRQWKRDANRIIRRKKGAP